MKAAVEEPRVTESSRPGQLDVELRFRNDGPDTLGSGAIVIGGYKGVNDDAYQSGLTSRKTHLSMTSRTLVSRLLAASRAGICWPPASR